MALDNPPLQIPEKDESTLERSSSASLLFDMLLVFVIITSVVVGLLETVPAIQAQYGSSLLRIEWGFTILFTLEYVVRIITSRRKLQYVFSLFGIIDFISVLPTYLTLVIKTSQVLQTVRLLRLIRVVTRLAKFSSELNTWSTAAFHLKHHLGNDEKMLLFFKPSRKKWIPQYALLLALFALSITELVYKYAPNTEISNIHVFTILSYIAFAFALFLLIKREYRIWSERYMLTTQRLLHSKGIFSEKFQSKTYQYITDIALHQSFWDKLLNTGNLEITTASGEGDELRINGVSDPLGLKKIINDNMLQTKTARENKPT